MSARLAAFCLRSLYREYGLAFLWRVALAHPLAAARGMARFARRGNGAGGGWSGGEGSLVGLGFCLKPLAPACPSGRANHRCQLLERGGNGGTAACRGCLIGELGGKALAGGSTVYIMTSARDMLDDVLLPALEQGRFRRVLLTMCRYSFEPIGLAMAICGVEATLVPFAEGDCRDYAAWREADLGRKPEQTALEEAGRLRLMEALEGAAREGSGEAARRDGNLYVRAEREAADSGDGRMLYRR